MALGLQFLRETGYGTEGVRRGGSGWLGLPADGVEEAVRSARCRAIPEAGATLPASPGLATVSADLPAGLLASPFDREFAIVVRRIPATPGPNRRAIFPNALLSHR